MSHRVRASKDQKTSWTMIVNALERFNKARENTTGAHAGFLRTPHELRIWENDGGGCTTRICAHGVGMCSHDSAENSEEEMFERCEED